MSVRQALDIVVDAVLVLVLLLVLYHVKAQRSSMIEMQERIETAQTICEFAANLIERERSEP